MLPAGNRVQFLKAIFSRRNSATLIPNDFAATLVRWRAMLCAVSGLLVLLIPRKKCSNIKSSGKSLGGKVQRCLFLLSASSEQASLVHSDCGVCTASKETSDGEPGYQKQVPADPAALGTSPVKYILVI